MSVVSQEVEKTYSLHCSIDANLFSGSYRSQLGVATSHPCFTCFVVFRAVFFFRTNLIGCGLQLISEEKKKRCLPEFPAVVQGHRHLHIYPKPNVTEHPFH